MRRILFYVDEFSMWVGKTFAWAIVLLMAIITYDVTMRYVFRAPTVWAYDYSLMLYGTLILMGGAYTLSRNGHVRGDMFYRNWPVRVQAGLDLFLYMLFFWPGIIALVWAGVQFAEMSRVVDERSWTTPGGPAIWPYKYMIPLAGALFVIQGIAETIRCIQALQTGEWPQRLADVEEAGEAV